MGLNRRGKRLFILTAILALLSIVSYMTLNVQSEWAFIISHRGSRLLGMLLVAIAMGLSTVVFQTITHNRILTPSLMGFDVLYVLVQALMLILWGTKYGAVFSTELRFVFEIAIMATITLLLFRLLFNGSVRGLHALILLGIMSGLLFRELTDFTLRLFDPSEFSIQQVSSLANFNRIDLSLLGVGVLGASLCATLLMYWHRQLDALILGREVAINLGVSYHRTVTWMMLLISVLISISTALVGPMLFFGLLIANIAYWLTGTYLHRWTLPTSVLTGVVFLIGGQVILEHLLKSSLPLAMMIELGGGIVFIVLLLRGAKR